jgi:hypothetical protein
VPNFAFLGLTYLVFAFPGFLYRWIYLSGEFTQQLLRRSWTDEIGKAVLIAIPFDALWIGVFESFKHAGIFSYTVTSLTAFELLSGTYPDPGKLVATLYANAWYILGYYWQWRLLHVWLDIYCENWCGRESWTFNGRCSNIEMTGSILLWGVGSWTILSRMKP